MKLKFLISLFLFVVMMVACGNSDSDADSTQIAAGMHKVKVLEVLQTSSYTYMNVQENEKEYWLATGKRDAEKGQTLFYKQGMEMSNFPSKELDRTFATLLLVDNISENAGLFAKPAMPDDPKAKERIVSQKQEVKVEPAPGGVTIAEIYKNKANYSGKTVTIRGKVTKFNANILGKNWIHIQDGTRVEGNHDLTITTEDMVKVGETVTFSGTITLDKDFGAGYKYQLIMEKAKIKKES